MYTCAYIYVYVCMYFIKWNRIGNESSANHVGAVNIQNLLLIWDLAMYRNGCINRECICRMPTRNFNRQLWKITLKHLFNCFAYIYNLPQCVYDFIIICNANRRSTHTWDSRSNVRTTAYTNCKKKREKKLFIHIFAHDVLTIHERSAGFRRNRLTYESCSGSKRN